jgi:S1-C subfamily serine protease
MNNNQGVAITWVDPKGALGKTGFEANDIILGIENQPISVFGDNY